jgi:hypothetical protein
MKRKNYFSMASAAVVALALVLNITGAIGTNSMLSVSAQAANTEKINNSVITKTNTLVMADKTQAPAPSSVNKETLVKPQVEIPVNMEVEKGDQKNADNGSSPWKLDPVFVSQVFASLIVSPEGIQGDYPIKQEELKLAKNTETEAIVEVSSSKAKITKIYLKRLVKQDKTGIWTVVGYDQAS